MRAYILIHYLDKKHERIPDCLEVMNDFWHGVIEKQFESLKELREWIKNLRKKYNLITNTLIVVKDE